MQSMGLGKVHRQRAKSFGAILASVSGGLAILFAAIGIATNMQLSDILLWITQHFGFTFTSIFALLVAIAAYAIYQLYQGNRVKLWQEVGLQTANGISTLALTFTLLGISLGIGSLSEQSLNPENVNTVISILTSQFSMAFMTTVVGLPAATLVRAWVSIITVKYNG